MPTHLLNNYLNKVQYVSMADYMRRVDQFEDFDDKLAFTTRYLLSHGMQEGRDRSFEEMVHIAKMKLVDASVKVRKDRIMVPEDAVNPDAESPEMDADNRLFLADPVAYLKREVNRLLLEAGEGPFSQDDGRRLMNYQLMSATLTNDINGEIASRISDFDFNASARDVNNRLEVLYGGKKGFEKALNATKPGVLSKMFDTSSKAYHNLDEVYKAFNNPDHALYGDMNSLDKAATEYLRHCFPSWNPNEGALDAAAINRLSGTRKERAQFSLNILKSTAEQREMKNRFESLYSANRQKYVEAEAGVAEGENVFSAQNQNQNEVFLHQIQDQIAQDEASFDQEQAENDYHANFELGANEEDDPEIEP